MNAVSPIVTHNLDFVVVVVAYLNAFLTAKVRAQALNSYVYLYRREESVEIVNIYKIEQVPQRWALLNTSQSHDKCW